MPFLHFLRDGLKAMFSGGRSYWMWVGVLGVLVGFGAWNYAHQLDRGLVVTGMSDQVSWGLYIANFTFLVGIAASAVLLVIPAYIFNRPAIKDVVLFGDGIAVAAVAMAMMFVLADLGRPDRVWHALPYLGRFNWPASLLAWDMVVLSGYLLLNIAIPAYILYCHYRNREPNLRFYFPLIVVAIFWAISIHTVTAFLLSSNPARPFWHTALLGPRFIASAFASGPALIILVFQLIRRVTAYPVQQEVIRTLAWIMAVAMQINLFFVVAELFTDFYNEGTHAASIRYLFLGLHGFDSLKPWIWTAMILNLIAVIILTIHPLRNSMPWLNTACVAGFVGIWIEKGMGLVLPGFIPTPLGEIFEYTPTGTEIAVAIGIWATGILIFTLLAKGSIPMKLGRLRHGRPQEKSH